MPAASSALAGTKKRSDGSPAVAWNARTDPRSSMAATLSDPVGDNRVDGYRGQEESRRSDCHRGVERAGGSSHRCLLKSRRTPSMILLTFQNVSQRTGSLARRRSLRWVPPKFTLHLIPEDLCRDSCSQARGRSSKARARCQEFHPIVPVEVGVDLTQRRSFSRPILRYYNVWKIVCQDTYPGFLIFLRILKSRL